MGVDFESLLADLGNEARALDEMVGDPSADVWASPTPAPGWTIADQVIHLAVFDERARWSIGDPARFRDDLAAIARGVDVHDRERFRAPSEVLTWWRKGNVMLRDTASRAAPDARCEWYGPPMSAASMVTARLMETWAHGHDVADALGCQMVPTSRLRHVAHLGIRARAFAYSAHRREAPSTAVAVVLRGPDEEEWRWGTGDESNVVSGPALDFCQVVTRRRHVDDTELVTTGDAAREWMEIAQAFAGPPGEGRRPGQFAR